MTNPQGWRVFFPILSIPLILSKPVLFGLGTYVENLLLNPRDVDDTIYAMQVTTVLFANLVEAAFRRVDEGETRDYGINHAEFTAQRVRQHGAV